MKRLDKWKRAGVLVFAAALLGSVEWLSAGGLLTVRAAGSDTPLGVYSEEEMAGFQDHVLEYSEIQGLIEHYNPAYLNQLTIFNGNPDGESGLSKENLLLMAAEFRYEADELKEEMEEKENDLSEAMRKEYQDNIKTLKRYAREMESSAKGSTSTKRALRIVRNQLTVDLSAKYREYRKLAGQNELQQKTLELEELTYHAAKRQRDLGLYSSEELLAAENSLLAARTAMDSLTVALIKSRQELIMAFGWNYNGNPEILPVPEPDVEKIAAYDLATDTEAALAANYDVDDLRRTDKSEFNSTNDKQRQISEKQDQVRMQMEFLYKDVEQKLFSYKTALDGWTVAEAKYAQSSRKYQLGMLSRAEFLAEEITWLTAKDTKDQAAMDLTGAMETYDWAVKGLMKL